MDVLVKPRNDLEVECQGKSCVQRWFPTKYGKGVSWTELLRILFKKDDVYKKDEVMDRECARSGPE